MGAPMRNFWLVAQHEYRSVVARRGFLLGTLAVPLGITLLITLAVLAQMWSESRLPLGYVDQAGVLTAEAVTAPDLDQGIELRAYPDAATAQAALERQEVQAVFVLPVDYLATLKTDLYYLTDPPSAAAWGQFNDFVRQNLSRNLPPTIQTRVLAGAAITVQDVVSGREFSEAGLINIILPVAASFLFFFVTMAAASYLLRIVADEKENRTMEVLVTSVTPQQLIGGKSLGLLAATLTQLLVYVIAVVVGLLAAAPYLSLLQAAVVPWGYLGVMALFFLPAYTLMAGLMIAIGAAVTDLQQGQQVAGLLNLLFGLPLFALALLFENPGHPVVLLLTFFPLTAFVTVSLRWGLSVVPFWQLGVSWLLLVGAALAMIWVAARIFRAGMLRYGQPLTVRTALATLLHQGG